MAQVLLFHHAHGLTSGVRDFAEGLRRAGHTVHVPDLYEGYVFDNLQEGVVYAEKIGFGAIIERGVGATEGLPGGLVYAGFSLGVLPAQKLAANPCRLRSVLCCFIRVSRTQSSALPGPGSSGPDPRDGP